MHASQSKFDNIIVITPCILDSALENVREGAMQDVMQDVKYHICYSNI